MHIKIIQMHERLLNNANYLHKDYTFSFADKKEDNQFFFLLFIITNLLNR